MVRLATPSFFFRLPTEINLEDAEHVVMTLRQGELAVSKSDSQLSISGNTANGFFTQLETRNFLPFVEAKIQLNWYSTGGVRACTKPKTVYVGENLYEEIMS